MGATALASAISPAVTRVKEMPEGAGEGVTVYRGHTVGESVLLGAWVARAKGALRGSMDTREAGPATWDLPRGKPLRGGVFLLLHFASASLDGRSRVPWRKRGLRQVVDAVYCRPLYTCIL